MRIGGQALRAAILFMIETGTAMTVDVHEVLPRESITEADASTRQKVRADGMLRRLLWRDHLRIGLGPGWLAHARFRRGLRTNLAETGVIEFTPACEGAPWQGAVDALGEALRSWPDGRPDVTVVLSNHFVRYALLPWNAALRRDAEWLALARHRLSTVHGTAAENWVIRFAGTQREGPRVASAMDNGLLIALEDQVRIRGKLVSVQPQLSAVYNRLLPFIAEESCWLVIEEPGRLTVALLDHGIWRAVRSRRRDESARTTLQDILDREAALLGLTESCARVVLCTHAPREEDLRCGRYEVRDLTFNPGTATGERKAAMALE
jgi:hypothetical protein